LEFEFGFWFESFPLCYTAGRHEGTRRKARVELMTEPPDRAVLLLQRVGELLLESRAIAQQLEVVPDGESSADAADRIADGILLAALEEGLVTTIRHALEVLKRFSAPGGVLGEKWLNEQERRLEQKKPSAPLDGPTADCQADSLSWIADERQRKTALWSVRPTIAARLGARWKVPAPTLLRHAGQRHEPALTLAVQCDLD